MFSFKIRPAFATAVGPARFRKLPRLFTPPYPHLPNAPLPNFHPPAAPWPHAAWSGPYSPPQLPPTCLSFHPPAAPWPHAAWSVRRRPSCQTRRCSIRPCRSAPARRSPAPSPCVHRSQYKSVKVTTTQKCERHCKPMLRASIGFDPALASQHDSQHRPQAVIHIPPGLSAPPPHCLLCTHTDVAPTWSLGPFYAALVRPLYTPRAHSFPPISTPHSLQNHTPTPTWSLGPW